MRPLQRPAAFCVLSLVLSACGSLAPRAPAPPPALDLISSAPLVVADGCDARGSYVVGFTVTPQGRTTNIEAPEAPACVREALASWAASFQFSPPQQPVRGSMEWMLVTASRGS
jgi:hypothetical protein